MCVMQSQIPVSTNGDNTLTVSVRIWDRLLDLLPDQTRISPHRYTWLFCLGVFSIEPLRKMKSILFCCSVYKMWSSGYLWGARDDHDCWIEQMNWTWTWREVFFSCCSTLCYRKEKNKNEKPHKNLKRTWSSSLQDDRFLWEMSTLVLPLLDINVSPLHVSSCSCCSSSVFFFSLLVLI